MIASALVVIFDTPQAGHQANSSASSPQAETTATDTALNNAVLDQPLTSSELFGTLNSLGIPSKYVYVPNVNAVNSNSAYVTPLYDRSPAPMGVADYGFMNSSGVEIPYAYNTTSFMGTSMFEALQPYYPMNGASGTVSLQMNTVLNGVTILGNGGNVFWAQNVALYTPSTGIVELIDNIWNFSSPSMSMPSSTIYSGGGHVASSMFYYYVGPNLSLSGTYTLNLFTNSSIIDNRNALVFSYEITNTANNQTISQRNYDTVIFNSVAPGSTASTPMAYFQVNGYKKTPSGMLYDAEMVLGGPGAGSTTNIFDVNGQFNLKFLSGTSYAKLPAAYNFGSNTGETVEGLSTWWTSVQSPVVHLSNGPSILVSMWGSTQTHSGALNIMGTIDPANSFMFVNVGDTFDNSTAAWAPLNATGTYKFAMPGGIDYAGAVFMSEYEPFYFNTSAFEANETTNETGGGPPTNNTNETTTSFNVTLTYNRDMGIYTPLYAIGDAQVANLTLGSTPYTSSPTPKGSGTPSDPYRIENNQYSALNHLFTSANHYLYPTFFGIMIMDTTVNTTIQDPAPFNIQYPPALQPVLAEMNLPLSNNLNMVFVNTSGVSLFGASDITGWFPCTMNGTSSASVMFLDSTSFLVGESTFNGMGSSLMIYNAPGTSGDGTVFGNHFLWHLITRSGWSGSLMNGSDPYGVSVFSSGNLIYNNYFDTHYPAYSPSLDVFTGSQATYSNDWNLSSLQPADYSMMVNGFDLSGPIIDVGYMGGNYWSQYDGSIPYSPAGKISLNGDFYPLVPPTYDVTFTSASLPAGNTWGIVLDNQTLTTTGTSVTFQVPNGTYSYSVITPSNYIPDPARGEVYVYGGPVNQAISFTNVIYPITVTMTGLPQGTEWGINVAGEPYTTTSGSLTVYRDNGTYDYGVIVPQLYSATPASGSFFVFGSPVSLDVTFSLTTYTVTFQHEGLPTGTEWSMTFDGQAINTTSSSVSFTTINGNYSYSVDGVSGYSMSNDNGYVLVNNGSQSVTVQFSKNPDTVRTIALLVGGIALGAGAGVGIAYFFFRKPQ